MFGVQYPGDGGELLPDVNHWFATLADAMAFAVGKLSPTARYASVCDDNGDTVVIISRRGNAAVISVK